MGREIVARHWTDARGDGGGVGLVAMRRGIAEQCLGVHTVL